MTAGAPACKHVHLPRVCNFKGFYMDCSGSATLTSSSMTNYGGPEDFPHQCRMGRIETGTQISCKAELQNPKYLKDYAKALGEYNEPQQHSKKGSCEQKNLLSSPAESWVAFWTNLWPVAHALKVSTESILMGT